MHLQVKDVLSPEGFLYMVTVMENKPTEILELLAEDGIKGSYFQTFALGVTGGMSCLYRTDHFWQHEAAQHPVRTYCMVKACASSKTSMDNAYTCVWRLSSFHGAGKVVLERAADEEALRILCCWRA